MAKMAVERRAKAPRIKMSMQCDVMEDVERAAKGTSFDLSTVGMCLYVDKPLEVGRTLSFQCGEIWDKPKTGIIRWVSRVHARLFRIGVEFGQ